MGEEAKTASITITAASLRWLGYETKTASATITATLLRWMREERDPF